MTIDDALKEWSEKNRRMGCNAATKWFCKRVKDFKPKRLTFYTEDGMLYQHVVAFNGIVEIDLAPYARKPKDYQV